MANAKQININSEIEKHKATAFQLSSEMELKKMEINKLQNEIMQMQVKLQQILGIIGYLLEDNPDAVKDIRNELREKQQKDIVEKTRSLKKESR